MRLAATAVLMAWTIAACGGKGAEFSKEKTARGQGYEFPVPKGYAIASNEEFKPLVAAGGIVLARTAGAGPRMLGSIVVAPVEGSIGFDVTDAAACKTFAEAGAKSVSTKLLAAKIIDTASGKTCQWRVRGSDGGKTHEAMATVMMAGGGRVYVLTCNFSPDDIAAQKGCNAAVRTWKAVEQSGG